MLPMGVGIYQTASGEVEIAAANLSLMSHFFTETTKEVFAQSGIQYGRSVEAVK